MTGDVTAQPSLNAALPSIILPAHARPSSYGAPTVRLCKWVSLYVGNRFLALIVEGHGLKSRRDIGNRSAWVM